LIIEFALPLVKAKSASVLLVSGIVTVKAELPAILAPPVKLPVRATVASVPALIFASLLSGVGVGFGVGAVQVD